MEAKYITLTKENIEKEHICCAFSDKKCKDSYELKKTWLKNEFENGYVFRRLDERAKVFIEYGPAEKAWVPVNAPNYLMINCFWVSGKYKGSGLPDLFGPFGHGSNQPPRLSQRRQHESERHAGRRMGPELHHQRAQSERDGLLRRLGRHQPRRRTATTALRREQRGNSFT